MDCYFVNPHPNYYPNYAMNMAPPSSSEFVISDFLMLDDYDDNNNNNNDSYGGVDQHSNKECGSQSTTDQSSEMATTFSDVTQGFNGGATSSSNDSINYKKGRKGSKVEVNTSSRIAFRTRSELDVMDDGYKWRKYGKKSVKNSPNLRNYYKCSSEGCGVKKRVERDRDDSSYVITSYEDLQPWTSFHELILLLRINI